MIENLKNIIPYDITILTTFLSPLMACFYSLFLKYRYDKKLENLKSELKKDNKKHEIRLENYSIYYQKVDKITGAINEYSTWYTNEVATISQNISTTLGRDEAMNYEHYIESYTKIIKQINCLMEELRSQTYEFRFYASDNLLKHIYKLDHKYQKYFSYTLDDNLNFLQISLDKVKNLDFAGILESVKQLGQNEELIIIRNEIVEIHRQIMMEMRKELNLKE